MLLPDENPETPSQRNEKLCWKTYNYCAISGETMFFGTIDLERRMTLDQTYHQMFEVLAMRALFSSKPWNAMNVNLCLKAVAV